MSVPAQIPVPEIEASLLRARDADVRAAAQRRAMMLYRAYGCLVVRGALPKSKVAAYKAALAKAKKTAPKNGIGKTLEVGPKRFLSALPLAGGFDDPTLYANSAVLPLMRTLLGDDAVLGAFNCVTAQPGAEEQHLHKDHYSLFGNNAFDADLPPISISAAFPLIDMGGAEGSTRVIPGSHLQGQRDVDSKAWVVPKVRAGDCLLFDYKLWHGGTPNQGKVDRPVLYVIYYRPWFRDCANHASQPELIVPTATIMKAKPAHRGLFANLKFWDTRQDWQRLPKG